MKPRSSIFSSSTLRLPPAFWLLPRTAFVAAGLLAAAELSARWAVSHQKLELDPSANVSVAAHLRHLNAERPATWLMGNSTLYFGVDISVFAKLSNTTVMRLEHGSATARASAALLRYYLRNSARKPAAVVLFISKDDLNANGYRADVSRRYLQIAGGRDWSPADHLVLLEARDGIVAKAENAFNHAAVRLHLRRPQPTTKAKPPPTHIEANGSASASVFDGMPIVGDQADFLLGLMTHFVTDEPAIAEFANAAHDGGVRDVTIVYMPATDRYVQFHDAHTTGPTWAQIDAALASDCAAHDIRLIDCSGPRNDYENFQDPYHLNNAGKAAFTPVIARAIYSAIIPGSEGKAAGVKQAP